MKKFRQKGIFSIPDYISQRENYLSSRSSWFHDSSLFLSNRLNKAKCLYSKDLFGHYGCINAIEFSNDGKYLVSGGDDRYVQLWNVNKAVSSIPPTRMKTQHQSNVFCLAFDSINSKILSAGNDGQIIVHDTKTGEILDVFLQEMTLYGLSMCPNNDSVFASAGEDGKIKVFDMKARAAEPTLIAHSYNSFHGVQFHPTKTNLIISANSSDGVILWDIRKPKHPFLPCYGGKSCKAAMSVKFNSDGSQVLALVRRNCPVLFDTNTGDKLAMFDAKHYYNSCTMKSCYFAGANDEFVLSGSDDFNLYMWKVPQPIESTDQVTRKPHMVLKGHRSIVNQVRFNKHNFLIATSGVEKIVKLWSPLPMPACNGGLDASDSQVAGRRFYTQSEYLSCFGDYGRHNLNNEMDGTEEDLSMLAFFDALVHREISDIHSPWSLSDQSETSDWSETEMRVTAHRSILSSFRFNTVSPEKPITVDEMLPVLIANRRHKLKVKQMLEAKLANNSVGASRRAKLLSGLTPSNLRLVYTPNFQEDERTNLTDIIPNLNFRRRTMAPYTIMEVSSDDSSSDSNESFKPTTSRKKTKTMRNKAKKRPVIFDTSDEDSLPPTAKKMVRSPEIGPQYEPANNISGIISSDDQLAPSPLSMTRNGVKTDSKTKTCCQGSGCSSKCRRFVPICSISDDDDTDEENDNCNKKSVSPSAETPDSGIFLNSLKPEASSSNSSRPSTTTEPEDCSSPNIIKFSISKAKNARQRCYRGQM